MSYAQYPMQTTLPREYPWACRERGSTRLRDNNGNVYRYCRRCRARKQYRVCVRSSVERIEKKLKHKPRSASAAQRPRGSRYPIH